MQIPEFDGFVSGAVGVIASGSYQSPIQHKVHSIEVKLELLPNNGSATAQAGRIYTLYCEESNAGNLSLGPGVGEIGNNGMVTGMIVLKSLVFAGSTVLALIPTPITLTGSLVRLASWMCRDISGGLLISDIHRSYSSANFVHEGSAEGQGDFFTQDQWNYWKLAGSNGVPTVNWAEGHSAFDWRFRTDSNDVFAIKVTATVTFGECYPYVGWTNLHTDSRSTIISMANYWN
jgi:hypothetical protein